MRYWWASQGENFQHVARSGNLWTCPTADGRRIESRELIKDLARGDMVFHYGRGQLRAVSEVTAAWMHHPRPPHYGPRAGEGDDGWLVTTQPMVTELEIPIEALEEVIARGKPGPLDRHGRPAVKFLSRLASGEAAALIQMIDVHLGHRTDQRDAEEERIWAGESTSALREALARREQSALRDHLLKGRGQASCALCGRQLPAELLVAAHIRSRYLLDDTQRRDLDRIAMLACVLGCDALFEHGYIGVDDSGTVRALTSPGLTDLAAFTRRIAGRRCAAHTQQTADKFAAHLASAQRDRDDS